MPHLDHWLQGENVTAWTETQTLALYRQPLSEHTQISVYHVFALPTCDAMLWPLGGQIFVPESLLKRKNTCYFFQLCSFTKNPILFSLDNHDHTVHKCSMSLQAKGTRERSI